MTFVSKQNRLSLNLGHRLELAFMVLLLLLLIAGGVFNSLVHGVDYVFPNFLVCGSHVNN